MKGKFLRKKSLPSIYNNMAPSAQSDPEQGQGVQSSNIEHKELPDIHVNVMSWPNFWLLAKLSFYLVEL